MTHIGAVGYLPQDPARGGPRRAGARDRVLSARGLDTLLADLEKQQVLMAEGGRHDAATRPSGATVTSRSGSRLGGYAAESEAGRICSSLGLWNGY